MAEHNDKGNWGEQMATNYLEKKGYTILERNFVYDKAELDIIAQHEEQLVIIEVKTRSTAEYGSPIDAISSRKIKLILHATDAYIQAYEIDLETRFDVISVIATTPATIEHIEDAFYPQL